MTTLLQPAPDEFSEECLRQNPILHFFHYRHLPAPLFETSKLFCDMAQAIIQEIEPNAERSAALRKLLEAKDCAVRAKLSSIAR